MQAREFWQEIEADAAIAPGEPFYAARLDDGRVLRLPIRPLGDSGQALASLILNQASFAVVDALAGDLAGKLQTHAVEVVVGLPTLGLTLASALAAKLGHSRYAPLGTSRKFWYRDELSAPLSSITTPHQGKRLYLDPRLLPLLAGRRVALVDDVLSTGASIVAGLDLMALCGVEPVVIAAAMLQSERWRERLAARDATWPARVVAALRTPILERDARGAWRPV